MRFNAIRYMLPMGAAVALGAVVACSGSSSTQTAVSGSTNPANVVVTMYDAAGVATGTCAGALVNSNTVVTAGHCVAGKASASISAPYANNQSATATSGSTYDWQDFNSTASHPGYNDIGVWILSEPITLKEYPKLATSRATDGSVLARVSKNAKAAAEPFSQSDATVFDASSVGFPHNYYVKGAAAATMTAGAPLYGANNTIYGVVSGQGSTSGDLYIARTDEGIAAGWTAQHALCHTTEKDAGGSSATPPPGKCWGNCTDTTTITTTVDCDGGDASTTTTTTTSTTGGKSGTTGGKSGTTGGKSGTTGGKSGTTGGDTSGGYTTSGTTGGGSTNGGYTTGGASTAGGDTTGGNGSGGNTTAGTTGGNSTAGTTGGNSTAGGDTTGGNGSGGSATAGDTTGGASTAGSTTGASTSGDSTGGASSGGASSGGTSNGGGGCVETTTVTHSSTCVDNTIIYGDCGCTGSAPSSPILK